jgi:chondroitin AC lyase
MSASGARPSGDRIKIAGILAKNALFQRNDTLFNTVIKIIEGEIKFATGPGLKYDYSFQHRPDRVTSTLSYGIGYADAFAEWAAFVSGTAYRFSDEKLKLLTDYYLDGICQTMAYGKYPDPGAMNRSITRTGDLDPYRTQTPDRLLIASQYRKDELEKIVKIRKGEITPGLEGSRFYWESEYFSNQRPGYFTSVRMYSSRNNNMEMPYNSEGLMNHHFADGSNFLTIKGDEYSDMFPVYDWQKIPGTTVVQKEVLPSESEIQKRGLTEFVGGVNDGVLGAAVFDFKSVHDPLTAKKAWFFFENEYVCLGTGITSEAAEKTVVTTLNQCLLKGDVTIGSGGNAAKAEKGSSMVEGVNWVFHNGTGYVFPKTSRVRFSNIPAKGSWYKINHQSDSPKDEITLDVFKLWIDHGQRPRNASYEYIVVPVAVQSELDERNNPEILSNTVDLQAVRHSGSGTGYIVFYSAGKIELFPGITIGSDSPSLVMVKAHGGKVVAVSVSDPSRRLSAIHLSLSTRQEKKGDNFSAIWNGSKNITELTMELPVDVYAGKPVTADLR